MPDPKYDPWPTGPARPAAIDARNRMRDYKRPEAERRAAAQEVLRQVLGGKPNDLTIAPPTWRFWKDTDDSLGRTRSYSPYQRYGGQTTAERVEGLDPQIDAAYSILERDYPEAAAHVYTLGQVPDTPSSQDTTGLWHPGWGALSVRTSVRGKPRSFQEIIETMKHELSHAMGTEDAMEFDTSSRKPVGSYDITSAARELHGDVNLPLEGSALRRALEKKK